MPGQMIPYVVREGDYLPKIGWMRGFNADEVWNDPKNAELREKRKTYNILLAGDVVFIPKGRPTGLPIEAGSSNAYCGEVPKTTCQLVFRYRNGEPYDKEKYRVLPAVGLPGSEGVTSSDGEIELVVPVALSEVTVEFPDRQVTYKVRVGALDPEGEPSGLRQRLEHLGLSVEPDGESADEALRSAVARFQEREGLAVTAEADEATIAKLREAHGS